MAALNQLKVDRVPAAFAEWARKHNELVGLIEAIRGTDGIYVKKAYSPGNSGRIIIGIVGKGGTGPIPGFGSQSPYPFDVTQTDSTHFTVRTGTINGFIPTNIGTTFVMVGTGTEYVVLNVTTTNAVVTGAVIQAPTPTVPPAAMPVVAGSPPTTFSILLAVLVAGQPFRTIGNGSLSAVPFESYRIERAMPTPDSLPYDSYYSWRTGVT